MTFEKIVDMSEDKINTNLIDIIMDEFNMTGISQKDDKLIVFLESPHSSNLQDCPNHQDDLSSPIPTNHENVMVMDIYSNKSIVTFI